MIRHYTLKREQWVPRPLPEVLEFFSNAGNLEILTPAWLRFKILAIPISMTAGTKIQYRISWHGLPLRWTTEILRWEPPREFVDLQLSGPYKLWHHTHRFEEERGGTRITDIVQYALPLGPLGWMAHALWVKRDVERIFDYRVARIEEMFQPAGEAPAKADSRS
jgi:ligand-binding SRPBCC domain-containing protein